MMESEKSAIVRTPSPNSYGSRDSPTTDVVVPVLRSLSAEVHASTVSFHSLTYTITQRVGLCGCSGKKDKTILDDIHGVLRPGMNAILGPTGSGKSSLLDILAGRKDPRFLEGDILIDGHRQPDNFKCMAGYVVQDDVVMGTLTVRENLTFSANLRLPLSLPMSEKEERVDTVLNDLGLANCADTKVGTVMIRGVSGGERKRTNIGMELITSPGILFLDEPTTGLDANTANSVMMLLHKLARRGRTIIFSIHQPRYSIFRLFDTMLLLHSGRLVYSGPATDALNYFEEIGHECEPHNNPPDFFLDVINADPGGDEDLADNPLADTFQKSSQYRESRGEADSILNAYEERVQSRSEVSVKVVDYVTPFYWQFYQVSKRTILNLIRNPQTSILQLFVMLFFGAIVGGIYFQLDNDIKAGIQNRVGAFFFIIMNLVFGNLSAVELFIAERPLFIHENSSGFYRVSTYFLAKVFCDVIPMRTIPVLIFGTVTYWMIGFRSSITHFLTYLATLLGTSLCASAISFMYSASVSIFAIANLLIALTYVFMMVFGGLLVNVTSLGAWIQWIRYISIFRYGIAALSINELKDLNFCNHTSPADVCYPIGNKYLEDQGIAYETSWDLWLNVTALGSMTLITLILCYIQLCRINKYK